MHWPLILEPAELHARRTEANLLIIDLCKADAYREGHLPGAVHLDTATLISGVRPATGQLPPLETLAAALAQAGITPDTHVVCYDDEGGPWAGRLAWTLDVVGHPHYSFLNGGKTAWLADGLPLEHGGNRSVAAQPYPVACHREFVAEQAELLARLHDPALLVWDARSREEYTGEKAFSARGGHIPGAVHCEWATLLDPARGLRLRTDLAEVLARHGITPDRDIVTHCQTHRRSGLTYIAARSLGYPKVRAYPGSWSEWGNDPTAPVTTGDQP